MKFHLDEHMDPAIVDGLRRRGIDVTTTLDAGLGGAPDLDHLEYARQSGRVIVTDDIDFIALAASGVAHSGIVYCRRTTHTIGQIIEHLVLIHVCLSEADMLNRIEFC